jgi:hypothetical protein
MGVVYCLLNKETIIDPKNIPKTPKSKIEMILNPPRIPSIPVFKISRGVCSSVLVGLFCVLFAGNFDFIINRQTNTIINITTRNFHIEVFFTGGDIFKFFLLIIEFL